MAEESYWTKAADADKLDGKDSTKFLAPGTYLTQKQFAGIANDSTWGQHFRGSDDSVLSGGFETSEEVRVSSPYPYHGSLTYHATTQGWQVCGAPTPTRAA